MPTVKDLIKKEKEKAENKVHELEQLLNKVSEGEIINEFSPKSCPNCGTKNYHYYPDRNIWCCANC